MVTKMPRQDCSVNRFTTSVSGSIRSASNTVDTAEARDKRFSRPLDIDSADRD